MGASLDESHPFSRNILLNEAHLGMDSSPCCFHCSHYWILSQLFGSLFSELMFTLTFIEVMFFVSATCHYHFFSISYHEAKTSHPLSWSTYMDGFLIILISLFPSLKAYLNYLGHFLWIYVFIHLNWGNFRRLVTKKPIFVLNLRD